MGIGKGSEKKGKREGKGTRGGGIMDLAHPNILEWRPC